MTKLEIFEKALGSACPLLQLIAPNRKIEGGSVGWDPAKFKRKHNNFNDRWRRGWDSNPRNP